MNWDALGAIAELLGAVAVFATLAYLAVQVRQNSRFIESSVYQSSNDVFIDWFSSMAADKTLADIWFNEIVPDKVSDEHRNQAKALLAVFFLALENNYHHQQQGIVNRNTLSLPGFAPLMKRRFIQDWLAREGRSALTPEFLAVIHSIEEVDV